MFLYKEQFHALIDQFLSENIRVLEQDKEEVTKITKEHEERIGTMEET